MARTRDTLLLEAVLGGGLLRASRQKIEDQFKESGRLLLHPNMLSSRDKATIEAELERLQKAQRECTDGGIRKKIEEWIEAEKKKLHSEPETKKT